MTTIKDVMAIIGAALSDPDISREDAKRLKRAGQILETESKTKKAITPYVSCKQAYYFQPEGPTFSVDEIERRLDALNVRLPLDLQRRRKIILASLRRSPHVFKEELDGSFTLRKYKGKPPPPRLVG